VRDGARFGRLCAARVLAALAVGALVVSAGPAGCTGRAIDGQEERGGVTVRPIEAVLNEYAEQWMSIPGVVGTAQGLHGSTPCIKVYVAEKTPALEEQIPDVLHGHPVVLEEVGELRALPRDQD